jgi:hypothetical protein
MYSSLSLVTVGPPASAIALAAPPSCLSILLAGFTMASHSYFVISSQQISIQMPLTTLVVRELS